MKIDIKINRIEFKVQKSTHTSTCAGMYMFSHVQLFATPWTVACQAPLSMGLSRQEYRSRLAFPPARDLPNPGIKVTASVSPALASRFFTTEPPGKPFTLLCSQDHHPFPELFYLARVKLCTH